MKGLQCCKTRTATTPATNGLYMYCTQYKQACTQQGFLKSPRLTAEFTSVNSLWMPLYILLLINFKTIFLFLLCTVHGGLAMKTGGEWFGCEQQTEGQCWCSRDTKKVLLPTVFQFSLTPEMRRVAQINKCILKK